VTVVTVHGQICDHMGLACQYVGLEMRHWQMRPEEFRTTQPRSKLTIGHGSAPTGPVIAIARYHDGIWITATTTDTSLLTAPPLYLSAETTSTRDHRDVVVERVAIVRQPAQTCLRPIALFAGDPTLPEHRAMWRLQGDTKERIERAGTTWRKARYKDGPLIVFDKAADEHRQRMERRPPDYELYPTNRESPRSDGGLEHSPWRGKILRVS